VRKGRTKHEMSSRRPVSAKASPGRRRVLPIRHDGQISKTRQALQAKIFCFSASAICAILRSSCTHKRDVSRSSRTLGRDAMDALASARSMSRGRKRSRRTAKSCGPGAATLASSRWSDRSATVAKQAVHRGEHEVSRKAIARGKPGCLGCTCQNRVHSFVTLAHGAAGASSARLSLRPLRRRGTMRLQNSGEFKPRE
jgi:hypothetical protein